MARIRDETIFSVLLIIFLFLSTNFDPNVGFLFTLILLGDFMWFTFDKKIEFPFEREPTNGTNRLVSIILGIGLGLGFITLGNVLLNVMGVTQSFVDFFGATTPPLQSSVVVTFVTWAFLIPSVETPFFFGRVLERTIDFVNVKLGIRAQKTFDLLNFSTWWAVLIVSGMFMLFHLAAKGISNTNLLAITFVFGIVSCWVSIYFKQLRENVIMHATVNTLSVYRILGGKVIGAIVGP